MNERNTVLKCPVKRILSSECPNCKKQSLVIYDKWNRRIAYQLLCKYNSFQQIERKLEKSELKYMKCESCNSIFTLDWTKKNIPYPINKEVYKEFEKEL